MNIDIDYFKLDIDELIGEFTQVSITSMSNDFPHSVFF